MPTADKDGIQHRRRVSSIFPVVILKNTTIQDHYIVEREVLKHNK